jgi:type IV pilus assembly protein PilE
MTTRTRFNSFASLGGFTLVELMVTVGVASIIFAIAVPTYTSQLQKARRTDARSALLDLAGREERYLSVAASYTQTTTQLGYSGTFPIKIGSGYYNVTVAVPDPNFTGTGPSYVVTATPVPLGPQVSDSTCASFTVNQIGQHKSVDVNANDTSATCWAGS